MIQKTGIIHIVASVLAWLSAWAAALSGGTLFAAWLFDKQAPSIAQDVLFVAGVAFAISIVVIVATIITMMNDI